MHLVQPVIDAPDFRRRQARFLAQLPETAKNAGFSLVVMDENCHSQEDKKVLKDISDRYIYSFNELIKEFEVE